MVKDRETADYLRISSPCHMAFIFPPCNILHDFVLLIQIILSSLLMQCIVVRLWESAGLIERVCCVLSVKVGTA